jgi:hypothetical protein
MKGRKTTMPQFVLMLRDSGWNPQDLSAEEIQAVIGRYNAWNKKMRATLGQKLRDNEGRVLRRNGKGIAVTDGPYAEAKEVIGGFMIVEAASYEDVVKLCQDSPHFDFGTIEIRQIEQT